jgi:hypothetical protein
MRVVAVFATDAGVDVTTMAFRHAGGAACTSKPATALLARRQRAASTRRRATSRTRHTASSLGLGDAPVDGSAEPYHHRTSSRAVPSSSDV